MKTVLKILLAPVIFALRLMVLVCKICIQCAAWVIGIVTFLSGAFTSMLLLTGDTKNGLIMLAVTFLISPFGLPGMQHFFGQNAKQQILECLDSSTLAIA